MIASRQGTQTVDVQRFASDETMPVTVFVSDTGAGAWTLLCVHGFGDNLHTWQELRTTLEPRGARLVSFDLPGFGRSPLHRDFAAHYSIHAVDLTLRIAARSGDGPLILIGNSMGGSVCLGALIRDAHGPGELPPVRAGVLLSPATPGTRTPIFVRLLRVPTYRWMEGLRRRMPGRSRRRAGEILMHLAFRQILAAGNLPPRAWYESVLASLGREGALLDLEIVAREILMILRGDVPEIQGLLEGVGDVAAPVAVVRGEEDRVVGEPELRELARLLPEGRYVPLERVGHCPQNEAPERIAEMVVAML